MGSDEVGDDAPVVYEPGRRRATYTPPVRRKPAEQRKEANDVNEPVAVHDDDELARALEEQVSQLTISTPTVSAPTAPTAPTERTEATEDVAAEQETPEESAAPAEPQDSAVLTDDQVVKLIDEDIASHGDTLSAIEKLEEVLAVRAATMAIPIQYQDAPAPAEQSEAEETEQAEGEAQQTPAPDAETGTEPDAGATAAPAAEPETQGEAESESVPAAVPEPEAATDRAPRSVVAAAATSFDDILNPREAEKPAAEPEPTFSSWVAPVAIATGVLQVISEPPTPPERPERSEVPIGANEPLDRVPLPGDEEPSTAGTPADRTGPGPGPAAEPGAPAPAPLSVDSVPLPIAEPTTTQTHAVVPEKIDADVEDDADDERIPAAVAAGLAPMPSPRVGPDEEVLFDGEPVRQPLFRPEAESLEPTPLDRRVGRAARMFWLWFGATSSLVSVGVGALLFAFGLSLRQMIVATLVGVALSFLPLGLGTLAGKWSGQPTMVVSRATFGLKGNVLPAVLALVTRLFWGAVLLWLVATAVSALFTSLGVVVDPVIVTAAALLVAIVIAAAIAYFGYSLVARVQLIVTIASALLIIGMVAVTWRSVHFGVALEKPDAVWLKVVTGTVLVFSYLGLAWANSSAELARYQRPGVSGAASMLWATFGAALPPFVLISYGGLLAASQPGLAADLAHNPVRAFTELGLPGWYPVPLLLAVVISLVSAIVLNIYSGGFSLQALGLTLARRWSVLIVAAGIALVGTILLTVVPDFMGVLGLPTTLAVPVAAWAGLFASDIMIRTRRFHPESLLRSGGVYPDWRWVNLAMLVVASVVGLGLVHSSMAWLHWEGFLYPLMGVDPNGALGLSNIGVLVALGIGLVTPLVAGIPAVRRQEQAH